MPYVLVPVCLLALVAAAAWWSTKLLLQTAVEMDRLSTARTFDAIERLESASRHLRSTTADFLRSDDGGSCST